MTERGNRSFLNEPEERTASLTDEEFARFEHIMQMRGRAAAPVIAASMGLEPTQPANTGMFMPSTMPEMRGHDSLGMAVKIFRTWACSNRCDAALYSKIAVNTSETLRERWHGIKLVAEFLRAWEVLTKAIRWINIEESNRYWVSLRSMARANEICCQNARSSIR